MEVTQPPFGRPGLRTLAAIVFTDVVSFSAHMQRDEVKTLGLINRDFAEMRRLCEVRGGAVLKTTGDGLLCYFASAVEAVASALDMQKHFADLEKKLPPGDALQHRIGIHLGDVLVQDQDVMGDGVNIASRLQAEAEPGGICISQTVYDVVKNKIELKATYLGARELKNIEQAVPVYSLLLEAQARQETPAAAAKKSGRWLVPAAAAVAIMLSAAFVIAHLRQKPPPVPAPVAVAAPAPGPAPVATAPSPAPALATKETHAGNALAAPEQGFKNMAARREFLHQIREPYLLRYDYDGLFQAVQTGKVKADVNNPVLLRRSIKHMAQMKEWFLERLSHYTPAQPLTVPRLAINGEEDYKIYGAPPDKIVVVSDGGAATPSALTDLKPALVSLILLAAIKNDPDVPSDVILGAFAFARFYNLHEMELELQLPSFGRHPAKS